MRPFARAMFPARCHVLARSGSTDADAGATEAFAPPTGPPLPCRVRFERARPGLTPLGDTAVSPAQVAFPADPGAGLDDRIAVAGGRTLRALGPARARDAAGVLWVVDCEVVN